MASSNEWYSGQSQIFWTCKALLEGRTINHRMEFREARGWRLGAIIHRLKTEFSWPICVEYRGPENVAHYWLCKEADKSKLRFPRSAKALGDDGGVV